MTHTYGRGVTQTYEVGVTHTDFEELELSFLSVFRQSTLISSTSKMRVANGGIMAPAPPSP